MFRKILLPLDGSDLSNKSVDYALSYAKAARADIVAMPITPAPMNAVQTTGNRQVHARLTEKAQVEAGNIVESLAEAARRIGVHCDIANSGTPSSAPSPVDAIIDVYRRYCCDVIYISTPTDFSREERGIYSPNLAYQLLERSSAPVLVFR